jgi:nucleotide-binding universal stress UspA family protein
MLKKVKDELEEKGFEVKTIMTVGDPKDEILKVAESEKVDLIVVGYHGKGLMERILEMGSTAKAIIRKASCPVLVVKRKEQ